MHAPVPGERGGLRGPAAAVEPRGRAVHAGLRAPPGPRASGDRPRALHAGARDGTSQEKEKPVNVKGFL